MARSGETPPSGAQMRFLSRLGEELGIGAKWYYVVAEAEGLSVSKAERVCSSGMASRAIDWAQREITEGPRRKANLERMEPALLRLGVLERKPDGGSRRTDAAKAAFPDRSRDQWCALTVDQATADAERAGLGQSLATIARGEPITRIPDPAEAEIVAYWGQR